MESTPYKKFIAIILVFIMVFGTLAASGLSESFGSIKANAAGYAVGDIYTFGSYPQRRVTDPNAIATLNALIDDDDWVSYGYYSGTDAFGSMVQSDYMRYADVECNGGKYRAVTFSKYRPSLTQYTHANYYTSQNANGYKPNNVYWFLYDPIEWIVLDPSTGLLMCKMLIDSQAYSNTIYGSGTYYNNEGGTVYANDYESSSIRSWLNGEFFDTAFTAEEQSIIGTTTLNNCTYSCLSSIGEAHSDYCSAETTDKLFLPSYADVHNSAYGFITDTMEADMQRIVYGTDYAKCQGLWVYDYSASFWRLRSPGDTSGSACFVLFNGYLENGENVSDTSYGVRPAMRLNIKDAEGVTLSQNALSLVVGGTSTLTASVSPSDASNKSVTWVSSNESVATVSKAGLITALSAGTTTITVTTVDGGYTDTCEVTVAPVMLDRIEVKTPPAKLTYVEGDALDTAGMVIRLIYNSGTTETVSSGFTCTPTILDMQGEQTITVSYSGKTATFSVTVTAPPPAVTIHTWDEVNWEGERVEKTYALGDTFTMPENPQVAEEFANSVPWVDIVNGGLYNPGDTYTVTGNAEFYLLGDVSGDGSLDSYDISLLQRFVSEMVTVEEVTSGTTPMIWQVGNVKSYDADFDLTTAANEEWYDYYDTADASMLKRYVNGYDVTLG